MELNIIDKNLMFELLPISAQTANFPTAAANELDDLVNGDFEFDDMSKVIRIIYYLANFYNVLDIIEQNLINLITDESLKHTAWDLLKQERETDGGLVLRTAGTQRLKGFALNISEGAAREIDMLEYHLQTIREAEKNIKIILDSPLKIIYDYTVSAMKDCSNNKERETFLTNERDKIVALEEQARRFAQFDKKFIEVPQFKAALSQSKIIPPGIIRSLPTGADMYGLIKILSRGELVVNFLLENGH